MLFAKFPISYEVYIEIHAREAKRKLQPNHSLENNHLICINILNEIKYSKQSQNGATLKLVTKLVSCWYSKLMLIKMKTHTLKTDYSKYVHIFMKYIILILFFSIRVLYFK